MWTNSGHKSLGMHHINVSIQDDSAAVLKFYNHEHFSDILLL